MTAAPEYEEVVDAGQIRRRCAGADDGGVRVEPPPDQAHLSRVVRLRGLPFPVTQDDVRAFFGRVGVESMVVCRNECGLSTGEAYVRVASLTDVGVALSMHLGPIRGRYIEVFLSDNNKFHAAVEFNDAVDKARRMRTSTSFQASCTQNQTRAYIRMRGLPYDCTDADVTRFFRPVHAAPTRIAWCSEKRCECIVELGSDVDACRAMTCNGNYIGKRYVELAPSSIEGFIEAARFATANAVCVRRVIKHVRLTRCRYRRRRKASHVFVTNPGPVASCVCEGYRMDVQRRKSSNSSGTLATSWSLSRVVIVEPGHATSPLARFGSRRTAVDA